MDYVPAFGVTYLPYIYDNKEQLFKLVDSDLFKDLSKQLETKGLYIVHSKWIYGGCATCWRPRLRPSRKI